MGCAAALALSREGARVTVLERSVPGAEASSAAAGILGAQAESHGPGPMTALSLSSRDRYPALAKTLAELCGIDIEYRRSGVLRVADDRAGAAALTRELRWQRRHRQRAERLGRAALRALEPALNPDLMAAVRFADDGRVEPKALLRALHISAQRSGAQFRTGAYVRRVLVEGGRARGVVLDDGSAALADWVVLAAGSWSTLVEGSTLHGGAVRPARGQIVQLASPTPILQHVVFGPRCYLVPRDDGRTLIGSTLEFVGYRREVTAQAVHDLLAAAIRLVPALSVATLNGAWSSFRPFTDDQLPLLGQGPVERLVFATGHYRNGILLAPITGEIVAALVLGKKPPLDLEPFSPARALARGVAAPL